MDKKAMEAIREALAKAKCKSDFLPNVETYPLNWFVYEENKELRESALLWLQQLLDENERLQKENERLEIAVHIDMSLGNTVAEMQTEIEQLQSDKAIAVKGLKEFIGRCVCKNGNAHLQNTILVDCPRCTWAREALEQIEGGKKE